MGCDIHIKIERQDESGSGWRSVPYTTRRHTAENPSAVSLPDVFDNRCYDLFGILADVRNGSGFAGIVTGDPWPSIAPYRGWPTDRVAVQGEDVDEGDHSMTWLSLEELKQFDWDGVKVIHHGFVRQTEYHRWKASGDVVPKSWSGGVSGGSVVIVPESKAACFSAPEISVYVESEWAWTARDATCDWPGQVIPVLEGIAQGRPLRLILSFDS